MVCTLYGSACIEDIAVAVGYGDGIPGRDGDCSAAVCKHIVLHGTCGVCGIHVKLHTHTAEVAHTALLHTTEVTHVAGHIAGHIAGQIAHVAHAHSACAECHIYP